MWYNLRHNNDGDPQTLHAACPVIVGSKWGNYFIKYSLNYIQNIYINSTSQYVTNGYASTSNYLEDHVSQAPSLN